MIHIHRPSLPSTAWSPPFVLALVVLIVELYVLLFLGTVSISAWSGGYTTYQWFLNLWSGGRTLNRGLPFAWMKTNILLAVYLWVMCHAFDPRRQAAQRWGLVMVAVALLFLQVVWLRSYDVVQPRFELLPLPR